MNNIPEGLDGLIAQNGVGFMNGDPWRVTDKDIHLPWSGRKDGSNFQCGHCGYYFQVGDVVRFVYMQKGENFMCCDSCFTAYDIIPEHEKFLAETKWIRDRVRRQYDS